MDPSTLCAHGLAMPGTAPTRPFGPDALVLKVAGRIFAIITERADPPTVSLKAEPELARLLRETNPAVAPGYHLDKRHWITVTLDGSVSDDELLAWLEDSYDLVVEGLPARAQRMLSEPE